MFMMGIFVRKTFASFGKTLAVFSSEAVQQIPVAVAIHCNYWATLLSNGKLQALRLRRAPA